MGILSLIGQAAQVGDPFQQLVQQYVQQNPQAPEPNRVTAPVTPDAGPSTAVPASLAPRLTKKKRGGVLGALESVFMPEPETLWASALRNGVFDAKAGQQAYQQGQTNAQINAQQAAAATRKTNAEATRLERQGNYTVVGNNVLDNTTGQFMPVPTTPTENERLIETWRARRAANPNDPTLPLIERAVRGYQYTDPVIQAQAAARTNTGVAVARERGAQARATKRTAGAGGGGSKVAKPPAGFILNP